MDVCAYSLSFSLAPLELGNLLCSRSCSLSTLTSLVSRFLVSSPSLLPLLHHLLLLLPRLSQSSIQGAWYLHLDARMVGLSGGAKGERRKMQEGRRWGKGKKNELNFLLEEGGLSPRLEPRSPSRSARAPLALLFFSPLLPSYPAPKTKKKTPLLCLNPPPSPHLNTHTLSLSFLLPPAHSLTPQLTLSLSLCPPPSL